MQKIQLFNSQNNNTKPDTIPVGTINVLPRVEKECHQAPL